MSASDEPDHRRNLRYLRQGVRFDWTISVGTLVHLLAVVCIIIGAYIAIDHRLTMVETQLGNLQSTFAQRQADLIASNHILSSEVARLGARISYLEGYIDQLLPVARPGKKGGSSDGSSNSGSR